MNTANQARPATASAPPRFLPCLMLLFVGSGCAALIYEIVWLQWLQLVVGLTSVSLGVLLGTFMGGMCLGSLLLPRLISPRWHPLRVYAALELGIGIIGLAVLFAMPYIGQFYTVAGAQGFTGILVRGLVAAVCLLPPTLLMGATLPAISRWVEATPQGVSWLGFFYGGNIAGAVGGCLFAGFYLLRVHDTATATYAAAAINTTVATLALALSGLTPHTAPAKDATTGQIKTGSWAVYAAIGLSGFTALGAEVVWTRLLSLLLGGTVYTFSIILAVFLAGLGIGSGFGSFWSRSLVQPRVALGICQMLLVGAAAWTAYLIVHSLPYWPIDPGLSRSPWFTFQLDLARCLWVILPAAILWGASFPLALAAVTAPGQDPGRLVGGVYAANTVGAIVGALGFSLLVIPLAGSRWGQRLLIIVPALAALFALGPLLSPPRLPALGPDSPGTPASRPRLAVALTVTLGIAAALAWGLAPAPWALAAYGRHLATYGKRLALQIVPESAVPAASGGPDIFCTYWGEGLNGSVAVTKWTSGVRNFHSAGKVQASNDPRDMRLQRLLGHISALAHPRPESVLVVACGAGVTAGTFVLHPSVKRIVVCDIESLVPRHVTPMFEKENYGVLKNPRTRLMLDDGRHFIRTTKEKFDIITSDPIDPWVKGCAALNTVDYYQMCKAHLKPGGVMTLWIPLYESNLDSAKSLIATFFKVFPHGLLWSNDADGEGYDAVLFGQAEPTQIDVDKLQERLDSPDHALVRSSLAEVGFSSAVGLLATYAGQAADLRPWMQGAQINTDRNLRLQYLAGMSLNAQIGSEILSGIMRYCKFPDQVFLGSETTKQKLRSAIEGAQAGN